MILNPAAAKGGMSICSFEYTGTGQSGSGSPTVLEFPFEPKVVFISRIGASSIYGPAMYVWGASLLFSASAEGTVGGGSNIQSAARCIASVSDKTLSFYSNSADNQLNRSGGTYRVVAIGE